MLTRSERLRNANTKYCLRRVVTAVLIQAVVVISATKPNNRVPVVRLLSQKRILNGKIAEWYSR